MISDYFVFPNFFFFSFFLSSHKKKILPRFVDDAGRNTRYARRHDCCHGSRALKLSFSLIFESILTLLISLHRLLPKSWVTRLPSAASWATASDRRTPTRC